MSRRQKIHIYWTDWLKDDSPYGEERDALYMYATPKEPVYIGKAISKKVKERYIYNYEGKVGKWIRKHIPTDEPCKVKIGRIRLLARQKRSTERFSAAEALMIYLERNCRGHCRGNIQYTQSIPCKYQAKYLIVNHGKFRPLKEYYPHLIQNG